METHEENDPLADAIIAFFKSEFDQDVIIYPPTGGLGYYIETDAGASFTFEIYADTRAAVARKYFDHIREVWKFVVDNRRSGSWLDGGRRYSRAEKANAREQLAKFDAWAAQHLKP